MSELADIGMETTAFAPPPRSEVGVRVARRMEVGEMLLRRWGGCWIDLIVLAILIVVPSLGAGAEANWAVAVGLLAAVAYFPVTEGIWGRSLGKLATGTIVVGKDGKRPGIGRIIVRTLFRLIEVNPFLIGGIPAAIVVGFTPTRQRLGDLVGGTYVVTVKDLRYALSKADASIFD